MARTTSISLGDHFAHFVDKQVEGGRYHSASDVVRAGLRLLEEREASLSALQTALIEGEESGDFQDFNVEPFLASVRHPAAE